MTCMSLVASEKWIVKVLVVPFKKADNFNFVEKMRLDFFRKKLWEKFDNLFSVSVVEPAQKVGLRRALTHQVLVVGSGVADDPAQAAGGVDEIVVI